MYRFTLQFITITSYISSLCSKMVNIYIYISLYLLPLASPLFPLFFFISSSFHTKISNCIACLLHGLLSIRHYLPPLFLFSAFIAISFVYMCVRRAYRWWRKNYSFLFSPPSSLLRHKMDELTSSVCVDGLSVLALYMYGSINE